VLGVNSAITRADEGDSTFAFAIAGSELAAFLAEAKQPIATVSVPCTSVEEQMAAERSADEKARLEAEERVRASAAEAESQRRDAIAQARARNEVSRENRMAIAALMLVLGGVALAGGGMLLSRDRRREAAWVAGGGGVLILGAALVFLTRPGFDESRVMPVPAAGSTTTRANIPATQARGRLQCTLVPERSRVTVTAVDRVDLDVGADGCINGRTQYAEAGGRWQRVLVPENEQSVSVLEFDPVASTYTNTRFLLSAEQMTRARQLRATVPLKTCSADQPARAALATQQQALRAALPTVYNEKLVYSCKPAGAATASDRAN
jgi:hypothetical protein